MIEEILIFSSLATNILMMFVVLFMARLWSQEVDIWEKRLEKINSIWYKKYTALIDEFEEYMKENERGNK